MPDAPVHVIIVAIVESGTVLWVGSGGVDPVVYTFRPTFASSPCFTAFVAVNTRALNRICMKEISFVTLKDLV